VGENGGETEMEMASVTKKMTAAVLAVLAVAVGVVGCGATEPQRVVCEQEDDD
jgi:hypothetical protein